MPLDWRLQDEINRDIERIRNADRVKLSTNEVETEIIENVHGRAHAREFTFEYDEPEYMAGGQNRAPRPLEYFLAGWAFCQQVMYSRNAFQSGIGFDSLRIEARGDISPKSAVAESEGGLPAGFVDDELEMVTHVESDESADDVAELARMAKRDCHAHASLQREMTLDSEIRLNGEPLSL